MFMSLHRGFIVTEFHMISRSVDLAAATLPGAGCELK